MSPIAAARHGMRKNAGASLNAYQLSVLADNPVFFHELEELAGTAAADSTGHGHTGLYALTGGSLGKPSLVPRFPLTYSADMTGYVQVADDAALNGSQFTIEWWNNGPTAGVRTIWLDPGRLKLEYNAGHIFLYSPDTTFKVASYLSNSNPKLISGQPDLYAVKYNGTTVSFFRNGQLFYSESASLGGLAASRTGPVKYGYVAGTSGVGQFDEVAYWTTAISDARLLAHYNAGRIVYGTYNEAVLADNPSAFWLFDETSGTVLYDASPNARHGIYESALPSKVSPLYPSDATGKANQYATSGTNHAKVPYAPFLTTTALTFEFWLNTSYSPGAAGTILHRLQDNGSIIDTWFVDMITGGYPELVWYDGGGSIRAVNAATPVNNGANRHIAITHDGVQTIKFYLDGALDVTRTQGTGLWQGANGKGSLQIPDVFAHKLDALAMWGTALSGAQIAAHYAAA